MFRNYFIRQMQLINPTQQTCSGSGFWSRDSAAEGVPALQSQWALLFPPRGRPSLHEAKGSVRFAGKGLDLNLCSVPSNGMSLGRSADPVSMWLLVCRWEFAVRQTFLLSGLEGQREDMMRPDPRH